MDRQPPGAIVRLEKDAEAIGALAHRRTPVRSWRRRSFAREVERIRAQLRFLADRHLLAESYARESSVLLRSQPFQVDRALALEADPVVVAYALRWLEVTPQASSSTSCSPGTASIDATR